VIFLTSRNQSVTNSTSRCIPSLMSCKHKYFLDNKQISQFSSNIKDHTCRIQVILITNKMFFPHFYFQNEQQISSSRKTPKKYKSPDILFTSYKNSSNITSRISGRYMFFILRYSLYLLLTVPSTPFVIF